MVLGILVGGFADTSLRRALLTYSENLTQMLTRPFAVILLIFLIFTIVSQIRSWKRKKRRRLEREADSV
jgi:putative tricarboxylic transport membrane protein